MLSVWIGYRRGRESEQQVEFGVERPTFFTVTSYGRAEGAQQRPGHNRGGEHVPVAEPAIPCYDFTPPGSPASPQNHELFHRQHPPAGLRLQKRAELPRPEPDVGSGKREPAGREAATHRQPVPGLQLQQRQQLVVAFLVVVHVLFPLFQAELVEAVRIDEQRDW